jgi:hypothetical protein
LLSCFKDLAEITALHLNMRKVKIIPHWKHGLTTTKRYIHENVVDMLEAEVCLSGNLLGVLLGPGAGQNVTSFAASKFWHRALEARALAISFKHSLHYYKFFAFPVLSYIIQYAAVPPSMLAKEARALQLLTRMPWNSITAIFTQHLTDLHFTFEAPSIERVAMAAAYRAVVRSPAFFKCLETPPPDDEDWDQLIYPKTPEWCASVEWIATRRLHTFVGCSTLSTASSRSLSRTFCTLYRPACTSYCDRGRPAHGSLCCMVGFSVSKSN